MFEPPPGVEAGFTAYDAIFYVAVCVLGGIAGLAATYLRRSYCGFWNLLAVSCVSGLTSFAIVAVIAGNAGATWSREPYFLGIATLVGFLGTFGVVIAFSFVQGFLLSRGINVNGYTPAPDEQSIDAGSSSGIRIVGPVVGGDDVSSRVPECEPGSED